MRGFFHLLYHQFAWTYDFVSGVVSIGMWQSWITAMLPFLEGPNILELGPGPGHLQLALARRGLISFGLDASPQMTRMAALRLLKQKEKPRIINGYAQFMPFQDAAFHQVLATFPTDYIFMPDTIAEIDRVLVPGGSCLILPAAWITATQFPFRWAARLFELTGQVPDTLPDWSDPFERNGFFTTLIPVELERSRLIILRARKRNA